MPEDLQVCLCYNTLAPGFLHLQQKDACMTIIPPIIMMQANSAVSRHDSNCVITPYIEGHVIKGTQ